MQVKVLAKTISSWSGLEPAATLFNRRNSFIDTFLGDKSSSRVVMKADNHASCNTILIFFCLLFLTTLKYKQRDNMKSERNSLTAWLLLD